MISARVKEVVIGSYDINPAIYRKGWKALRDAGIVLRDFDEKHREQVKALNTVSDANFLYGAGPVGGARFDYKQNGGSFKIYFDESQKEFINTRWTECGPKSIYAYGGTPGIVALAKYADEFDQVDDPGALDYASHSVDAREGDIVVFKGKGGYVLVKVCEVTVGPPWDTKDTSLKIQFQTRVFSSPN